MLLWTASSPILLGTVLVFWVSCLFSALLRLARKLSGGADGVARLLDAACVVVAELELGIIIDERSGTASSRAAVIESSPILCFCLRFKRLLCDLEYGETGMLLSISSVNFGDHVSRGLNNSSWKDSFA